MMFSGGGVTFTGGEPTVQFEALKELLSKCKEAGINTAIETNASHSKFCELNELIDYMIVDLKHYDCEKHKNVIGTSNEKTVENIREVSKKRQQLLIHIPLVGGFNSSAEDAEKFAELIKSFGNEEIDVAKLTGTSDMKKVKDLKGRPLLLFVNEWSIRMTEERNKGLILTEFAK